MQNRGINLKNSLAAKTLTFKEKNSNRSQDVSKSRWNGYRHVSLTQ